MTKTPWCDEQWLAQRRPVWIALSELFLDTELSTVDLERIAQIMADSGLSAAELEAVYLREVAPIVSVNLRVAAGVWAGFDEAWLCEQIIRRLRSRSWRTRLALKWARIRGIGLTEPRWQWLIDQVRTCRAKPSGEQKSEDG